MRQLVARKMKVVRPVAWMVCHCSAADDVVVRLSSEFTLRTTKVMEAKDMVWFSAI